MKIQILSDHHLEFRNDRTDYLFAQLGMKTNEAEVAIIAGDYIPGYVGEKPWFAAFAELANYYEHILYVPGNHDYYSKVSRLKLHSNFEALERLCPSIHILTPERPFFTYNRQRFIGSTMWYPDSVGLRIGWNLISDTAQIADLSWVFQHNAEFDKVLDENLTEHDIVITHHLPSDRSTPTMWKGSPTQPFFVHNKEKIISERQPKLWIHGHTHSDCDYHIGETRVFCNPIGYPSENVHLDSTATRSILEV